MVYKAGVVYISVGRCQVSKLLCCGWSSGIEALRIKMESVDGLIYKVVGLLIEIFCTQISPSDTYIKLCDNLQIQKSYNMIKKDVEI